MKFSNGILMALLCLILTSTFSLTAQDIHAGPHNCGITKELKKEINTPQYKKNLKAYKSKVEGLIIAKSKNKSVTMDPCPNGITVLPMAFHIYHEPDAAIGTGHNFSVSDINLVVDYLNMHYSGYNPRKEMLNDDFVNFDVGHTCIQFAIGKINRIPTNQCTEWKAGATHYDLHKCLPGGSGAGSENSPTDYLNIYINDLDGGLLGQASCIPGLFGNCNSDSDGITIDWDIVIPGDKNHTYFDRGGIMAHEVGHWLGLPHVDGDIQGSGCDADDGIQDTYPQSQKQGFGCQGPVPTSCQSPDNVYNYMDYSLDCAKVMFTEQQAMIMRDVMSSTRYELSTAYERLKIDQSTHGLEDTKTSNTPVEWSFVSCLDQVNLFEYQHKWTMRDSSQLSNSGVNKYFWEREVTGTVEREKVVLDSRYLGTINALSGITDIANNSIVIYRLKKKTWSTKNNKYGSEENIGFLVLKVEPCDTPVNDLIENSIELQHGEICGDKSYTLLKATKSPVVGSIDTTISQNDVWFGINTNGEENATILIKRSHSGVVDPSIEVYSENMKMISIERHEAFDGAYYTIKNKIEDGALKIRVYDEGAPIADPFEICHISSYFINDECVNAINVGVTDSCSWSGFTTSGSSPSINGSVNYNCGSKVVTYDVWFQAEVPRNGHIVVKCRNQEGFKNNLLAEVYGGSCGELEILGCQMVYSLYGKKEEIYLPIDGLTPGQIVYIRIGSNGLNTQGNFDLCVSTEKEAKCVISKIELGDHFDCNGNAKTFDQELIVNYTTESEDVELFLNGKFYKLTENPQRIIVKDLIANSSDITVNANLFNRWDGDCWETSKYYMQSAIVSASNCTNEQLLNDDCVDAIELKVKSYCEIDTFSSSGATVNFGDEYDTSCLSYRDDVWFKIEVPASGKLQIETPNLSNENHMILEAFEGDCEERIQIGCDRYSTGSGSLLSLEGLIPGDIILVRVADLSNDSQGDFGICVSEPSVAGFQNTTTAVQAESDNIELEENKEVERVSLNVYPNPVVEYITIDFPITDKNNVFDIALVDNYGRMLYNASSQGATQIDMTQYPAGVYNVLVKQDEIYATKRVVKL